MLDTPKFVLITGMSGAGKSQALRFFEDQGYFCVDNLPAALAPTFGELVVRSEAPKNRIAVCVDARSGQDLINLPDHLDLISKMGYRPATLFLDTSNEVLHQRYSESRRPHPTSPDGGIEEGIDEERRLLAAIRDRADLVIDTSDLTTLELRDRIAAMLEGSSTDRRLNIAVMSFGYKYGIPQDADLVWDVRFLPNPYYDDELREKPGTEPDVREYVLNNDTAREFMRLASGLLRYLIPHYEAEPKTYLTIAVGCTGGRHRSVAVIQELVRLLRGLKYDVRIRHRDVERDG